MVTGWTVLAAALVGSGPYPYGPVSYDGGMSSGPVSYGEVTASGVSGGYGDQLYPYEAQEPWLHGYFQEIPAYGGYHSFRPYNYKHVLSQSQTAAGFGMSPVMPYSQQFWHRYENRANLSPYANEPGEMIVPAPIGPIGAPNQFPGVGMSSPSPVSVPQDWNAGPVIVPAKAEQNAAGATGKQRWGRWAETRGE